jgi:hypothetical protein
MYINFRNQKFANYLYIILFSAIYSTSVVHAGTSHPFSAAGPKTDIYYGSDDPAHAWSSIMSVPTGVGITCGVNSAGVTFPPKQSSSAKCFKSSIVGTSPDAQVSVADGDTFRIFDTTPGKTASTGPKCDTVALYVTDTSGLPKPDQDPYVSVCEFRRFYCSSELRGGSNAGTNCYQLGSDGNPITLANDRHMGHTVGSGYQQNDSKKNDTTPHNDSCLCGAYVSDNPAVSAKDDNDAAAAGRYYPVKSINAQNFIKYINTY